MNEELKSKFSNIFIMLLFSVMTNDLEKVKHFLSNEMYFRYNDIINKNNSNNEIEMFDELNVKDINIVRSFEDEVNEYKEVNITSRYIHYFIDKETKRYKSGNNSNRIEKTNKLIFKKKKQAEERKNVIKCEHCGANLDINFTGACEYCGIVTDVSPYDYILIDLITY